MTFPNPYPITGIQSSQPEIRLGRLEAYGEGSEVPLGYYQITGIHGAPYIHWMEKVDLEDRPGDYCTHEIALFLTWHRPYLLLLEALLVVKDYPGMYWDWATDATLPHAVLGKEVDTCLPTPTNSQPFVAEDTTKRCPDLNYKSRPEVADEQLKVATVLDSDGVSLHDAIFHLLSNTNLSYGSFGNTGWHKTRGETEFLSLKSCHNTIHNARLLYAERQEGHMTEVPVSAFDPIFWYVNITQEFHGSRCQ
ncbi:tyrosinase copper-binding domain-containing protein [Trichophaea hybrida]|nr:tyrosinase copper-binding domain-containing protein [Trichophaea hybrida]